MSGIIIFGGLLQGLSFLFLLCLFLPFSFGYPRQMFISCTDSSRAAILELRCLFLWTATLSQGRPITWRRQGKLQGSESSRCHQISKIHFHGTSCVSAGQGTSGMQHLCILTRKRWSSPWRGHLWVTYDPVVVTSIHWPTSLDRTGMAPLLLMPQKKSQCSLQFDVDFKCFLFY